MQANWAGNPNQLPKRGEIIMKKILIIEDDLAIAEIKRDYLEADNFKVDIAPDGNSGLSKGLHGGFDLILLDLMNPSEPRYIETVWGAGYRFRG